MLKISKRKWFKRQRNYRSFARFSKQEVEKMLDLMLSVRSYFKDYQFVIAGAPSLTKDFTKNL
jgi:hypothetical protein